MVVAEARADGGLRRRRALDGPARLPGARAGRRPRTARPHRRRRRPAKRGDGWRVVAGRFRHRRRGDRAGPHRSRIRRRRLAPRPGRGPPDPQPGRTRRPVHRGRRVAGRPARPRRPTPTSSSRLESRRPAAARPSRTCTPIRTAGDAAPRSSTGASRRGTSPRRVAQGRPARRQRDRHVATRAHQARTLRRVAGQQRRLGAVARPLLGDATADLAMRPRPRPLRRVPGRALRAGRPRRHRRSIRTGPSSTR